MSREKWDPLPSFAPYVPGSPEESVPRGKSAAKIVKLASNENPLGASPRALDAARAALEQAHRYPEGSGRALREALARKWGVTPAQILLGNGSTEIVELLARALTGSRGGAVLSEQSFIMYRIAVQAAQAAYREIPLRDLRCDLLAMAAACDEKTTLLYLANPNNPTGTYVTKSEMEAFFRIVPDGVLTVLDEAYGEYLAREDYPCGLEYLREGKKIIVLRTFSKAYGLAGMRLGYALGSADLIAALERFRSPFNTSRIAQAAALGALEDEDHLVRSAQLNREGLLYLEEQLTRLGIGYTPGVGNFLLVHFDRPDEQIYRELLDFGLITRPMAPYGFPQSLRITVGAQDENRRLIEALAVVVAKPAR